MPYTGRSAEPGVGPAESYNPSSNQATINLLKRSLMETENEAKLWKEQADESRMEYIQCKSNAQVLRQELELTQTELVRVEDELRGQGELVKELRMEIDSLKEMNAKSNETKNPACNCNAEALEKELKSSQQELTRMRKEYEKRKKITKEFKTTPAYPQTKPERRQITKATKDCARGAVKNPAPGGEGESKKRSDNEAMLQHLEWTGLSARPIQNPAIRKKPISTEPGLRLNESHHPHFASLNDTSMYSPSGSSDAEEDPEELEMILLRPPKLVTNLKELDLKEEPAAAAEVAGWKGEDKATWEQGFAMAKQLDHELNALKHEGGGMLGNYKGADGSHQGSSGLHAATTSIGLGPIEVQLEKAHAKNAQMKKKVDHMHTIAYEYQRAYQQERVRHHGTFQKARVFEMDFNSARKRIHALGEELQAVRNELTAMKRETQDAFEPNKGKSGIDAGGYLTSTKTDVLSVPDVVQKVIALNEEIFQMSAYLADVLVYEVLEPNADRQGQWQEAIGGTYDCAKNTLGETLTSALAQQSMSKPKEARSPLLVQIVMQCALTNWCSIFGSRWTSYRRVGGGSSNDAKEGYPKGSGGKWGISSQIEQEKFISELYNRIRNHEDQAVAGRWRSLTKAYLPFSTNGWDWSLMLGICSIMSIGGWATRSDEDMTQVENRLGSIFKALLDLRKAIDEDLTSAELEIAIIPSGQIFDPSCMEDAYADGRSSSKSKKSAPDRVVGTCGLGLHRIVVKKFKGEGIQRQAEVLSMPKVVLEKTFEEAFDPASGY